MVDENKNKEEKTKTSENQPKNDDNVSTNETWQSEWMLRPCDMYKDEYNDCKSWKSRFQQHFIYGEKLDCSQWKIDFENCTKWKKTEDEEAYNLLVESEKKRRLDRLRPHYSNDVWQKRDAPPTDWNSPLPDWLVERNKGTFLEQKQWAIENKKEEDYFLMPSCTIL